MDVSWLSRFPEEDEKFFLGAKLMINNIRTSNTGLDFSVYVQALNVIQSLFGGEYFIADSVDFLKKRSKAKASDRAKSANSNAQKVGIHKVVKMVVIRMLKHELHRYAPSQFEALKNIPKYIEESVHFYCGEMVKVSLDWRTLYNQTRGYEFARDWLLDDEYESRWVDMNVLQMLFPNMRELVVEGIFLCPQTWEAVSQFCVQRVKDEGNGHPLSEIAIYRP